jgi:hypothetical protein
MNYDQFSHNESEGSRNVAFFLLYLRDRSNPTESISFCLLSFTFHSQFYTDYKYCIFSCVMHTDEALFIYIFIGRMQPVKKNFFC